MRFDIGIHCPIGRTILAGYVPSLRRTLKTKGRLANLELRTQKFIQHNSQRLNASNNANLLL